MKTIYTIISFLLLAMTFVSCNDKLDIEKHGSLSTGTFYKTDEQAGEAVAAIYYQHRDIEFYYKLLKNLFSDDFWAGGSARNDNPDLEAMNEFTFDTSNSYIENLFTSYYQIIYKANMVIANVEPDDNYKQQMIAEAKIFRAWSYFELTSMWGNPPLVDHPLEASEYTQPNSTPEKLWAFVEKDLTDAINSGRLVSKSSVDDNTNYRVTKELAYALLGKAYLWQGKYQEATEAFEKVINSGLYKLYEGNYGDVLTSSNRNGCESLFESNRVEDVNNEYDNSNYYSLMINWRMDHISNMPSDFGLYASGYGFCSPRKSLYDAFVAEEGPDGYRLNQTIKTYDQLVAKGLKFSQPIYGEGYFDWKLRYEAKDCPASAWGCNTNTLRWMRYSEVLLCAAEAYSRIGNQTKIKEYMDMIRNRAHVSLKPSYTLADIKNEKRLELFGECVRYQDLLRWDKDNDGTGAGTMLADQGKVYPMMQVDGSVNYYTANSEGKYGFKTRNTLLPYPFKEISQNTAIHQNAGWE